MPPSSTAAPVDVRNILGKTPADARLDDLYTLDKQIGKGAFGVVRLGHNKATGEPLAVKSISKAKLSCKEDIKDVQAEVAIMNLVAGHQNVVMLQVVLGCAGALGHCRTCVATPCMAEPQAAPTVLRRFLHTPRRADAPVALCCVCCAVPC
jgi:hypothetical protein